jgi:site-specific DNA-methyltransferase (adenine-specific)
LRIDKNVAAIELCNKRKKDYHVSKSAVKDGKYQQFYNLDNEIKKFIISINAVPVERNKGLDGIYSSTGGLTGIRFQRENESVSEVIALMQKASEEKPITKKIVIKKHESECFVIIPDDFVVLESLEYKVKNIVTPLFHSYIFP